MLSNILSRALSTVPLAHQEIDGWRGQADVFEDIFLVFMVIGTLVGVIVVSYMFYNAYKYRDGAASTTETFEPPTVGELPTGGNGGKKLFLSFAISAIIVIGLVAWTYTALLYVEQGAQQEIETEYDVEIEASQFSWTATYENGETETTFEPDSEAAIVIPEDAMVGLTLTSADVWHTFGVSEKRLKVDAIPGQEADSWILAEEQGTYTIECFELCGAGHSSMDGTLEVIDRDEFEEQYVDEIEEDDDD